MNITEFKIGAPAPTPLKALSESQIRATWKSSKVPLVSVLCSTYNHVDFIKHAINGVLAQQADFPFELIIRDDASTDGTAEIVKSYVDSHPTIVTAILEPENRWPEVKSASVFPKFAKGQYLASCEGDDYWIDPLKLQKQIDLVRAHPEISLCATHAVHIEGDRITGHGLAGGTRTYLTKPVENYPDNRVAYIFFGDTFRRAALEAQGTTVVLPEATAVWRKHPGGTWSSLADKDPVLLEFRRSMTRFWLVEHFLKRGDTDRAQQQLLLCMQNIKNAYPEIKTPTGVSQLISLLVPPTSWRRVRAAASWLKNGLRR